MRASLPQPLVDFLLSPDPDWEAPLGGQLSRPPVWPGADVFDLRRGAPAASSRAMAAVFAPALDARYPGSNSFAVAGTLTESGAAMLANDMHLGLQLPHIWYRAVLMVPHQGESRRVAGVTLPGTPMMIVGSNGHVAWGCRPIRRASPASSRQA